MRRRLSGFSLIELAVGLMIIALGFAAISMKANAPRTGIKREAERIAAYIQSLMQTADRYKISFSMNFSFGDCRVTWTDKNFAGENKRLLLTKNPRYKLSTNVQNNRFSYSLVNNNFSPGGTITVTDTRPDDIKDRSEYYIIIATIGGRVRTSPEPPDNWKKPVTNYTY